MNSKASDPFGLMLKKEAFSHFSICFTAFVFLWATRYISYRLADAEAIMLPFTAIGIVMDFISAVLVITFLRVFYGLAFWVVRPSIQRIAKYLFFGVVFGVIFSSRTEQAIGAKIEPEGVRFYFPYPHESKFYPTAYLSDPIIRETGSVSCMEYPDPKIKFVPIFKYDTQSQKEMRSFFQIIKEKKLR